MRKPIDTLVWTAFAASFLSLLPVATLPALAADTSYRTVVLTSQEALIYKGHGQVTVVSISPPGAAELRWRTPVMGHGAFIPTKGLTSDAPSTLAYSASLIGKSWGGAERVELDLMIVE